MALMQWNDSLATGHPRIDSEHKKLVDLINKLADAMAAGKAKDICGQVLSELFQYTKTHFAMEEQLMANYRYVNTAEHKAEHDKLVNDVLVFKEKFDAGSLTLSISLLKFLQDWLTNHIKVSDKTLVAAIATR